MMVGEMRDLESISFALTIAETGHLVLATMHTNDSAQTIDRIIDVFPAERRPQIQVQLAGTLLAVIYQRLVPEGRTPGMVAAYEVMVGVPAVRNLIREGKTRQLRNVVATHRADGMQTLERLPDALIRDGHDRLPDRHRRQPLPAGHPQADAAAVVGRSAEAALMAGGADRAACARRCPTRSWPGSSPVPGGWLVAPGNLQGITLAPQPAYVLDLAGGRARLPPLFFRRGPARAGRADGRARTSGGLCDTSARDLLGVRAGAAVPAPSRPLLDATHLRRGQGDRPQPGHRAVAVPAQGGRGDPRGAVVAPAGRLGGQPRAGLPPDERRRRSSATAAAPCTACEERRSLLEAKLPGTERVLRERPKGVREGKLLDALADLWTARRILARAITRLADPPAWDDDGVRMDIVC